MWPNQGIMILKAKECDDENVCTILVQGIVGMGVLCFQAWPFLELYKTLADFSSCIKIHLLKQSFTELLLNFHD